MHALSLNDARLSNACATFVPLNRQVVTRSTDWRVALDELEEEVEGKKGNGAAMPQSSTSDVMLVAMKHTWPSSQSEERRLLAASLMTF